MRLEWDGEGVIGHTALMVEADNSFTWTGSRHDPKWIYSSAHDDSTHQRVLRVCPQVCDCEAYNVIRVPSLTSTKHRVAYTWLLEISGDYREVVELLAADRTVSEYVRLV